MASDSLVAFALETVNGATYVRCADVATMLRRMAQEPSFPWEFEKLAKRFEEMPSDSALQFGQIPMGLMQ